MYVYAYIYEYTHKYMRENIGLTVQTKLAVSFFPLEPPLWGQHTHISLGQQWWKWALWLQGKLSGMYCMHTTHT